MFDRLLCEGLIPQAGSFGDVELPIRYSPILSLGGPSTEMNREMRSHLYPPPSPIFAGGANDHYVRCVSFSRDGAHVSTISEDGFVRFWDLNDVTDPVEVGSVNNGICCSYSPDGSVVAVGDRTGSVEFFTAAQEVQPLQHWARMAIRRLVPSTKVDMLFLPVRVKEYLKYKI